MAIAPNKADLTALARESALRSSQNSRPAPNIQRPRYLNMKATVSEVPTVYAAMAWCGKTRKMRPHKILKMPTIPKINLRFIYFPPDERHEPLTAEYAQPPFWTGIVLQPLNCGLLWLSLLLCVNTDQRHFHYRERTEGSQ